MTGRRRAIWAIGLTGLAIAVVAALRSGWYGSVWLEPGSACERAGECGPGDAEAALRALWWPVGAGLLLVAGAAVLAAWTLPPARRTDPARPLPAAVHALVAAVLVGGVAFVVALPALIALVIGAHALAIVLVGTWLAHALAVVGAGWVVRSVPSSPRREWLAALGTSAGALVAGLAATSAGGPRGFAAPALAVLLVVDAAAVAVVVLLQRALTAERRGRRWPGLLGGAAVLGMAGLAVVAVLQPPAPFRPVAVPPGALPTPSPYGAPAPEPAPLPESAEPAPLTRPPVAADVPCTPAGLAFEVLGFDGAMGARAAGLQVTNTGTEPCWVEGVPEVTLLQGGRPLALTVAPGSTPSGDPAAASRVGIAPGGTAFAFLTWRTYGGWADAERPQTVTTVLAPGAPVAAVTLPRDHGPAPFDIADGGTWAIAPWAPSPP